MNKVISDYLAYTTLKKATVRFCDRMYTDDERRKLREELKIRVKKDCTLVFISSPPTNRIISNNELLVISLSVSILTLVLALSICFVIKTKNTRKKKILLNTKSNEKGKACKLILHLLIYLNIFKHKKVASHQLAGSCLTCEHPKRSLLD